MEDQDSADGYEEIGNLAKRVSRPSALQLVGPKQGPSRTLWSEIPEVINSEILCKFHYSSPKKHIINQLSTKK